MSLHPESEPDDQYALSHLYSNRVGIVLPIGNRIALFNNQRKFVRWLDVISPDDLRALESTCDSPPSFGRRTPISLEALGLL